MGDLSPTAAYAAAIEEDGSVHVRDLSDPSVRVVIVAEYDEDGTSVKAYYHEDVDRWEICGPDYQIVGPDHPLYERCDWVVAQFRQELFDPPLESILTRKMAKSIRDEIDRDIINDLLIASGKPPLSPPAYVPPPVYMTLPTYTTSPQNRKLKATWTLDKAQDLSASRDLVGVSQLVKQRRPS